MDVDSLNQGLLRGRALAAPRISHANHGVTYYVFPLEVERLSGATDTLNVVLSQDLLLPCPVEPGETYTCTGEVRSFNNHTGVGGRLIITFFAKHISPSQEQHANQLELWGVLCKAPVVRRTPLGREICDLLLAVNRSYGRADYLPCIAWGSLAVHCGGLDVGDKLRLEGRLQSRQYHKLIDGEQVERTAFEISVMNLLSTEDVPFS